MGCTCFRPKRNWAKGDGDLIIETQAAGVPTVTTYQNNDGSFDHGMYPVPQSYGMKPFRTGQTNNQFLSSDLLATRSKLVPPQPPFYSPTPPSSIPPVSITPTPNSSNNTPSNFNIPMGPSTQNFYQHKYKQYQ